MSVNILLVEDDDFLRNGMTELLSKEGYTVTPAKTVKQAETYISLGSFDLITLDRMLPDGSGIDVCRRLRTSGKTTPVLFITACDDENDIVTGLDAGADDYVTKPFNVKELLARVRSLLRRNTAASGITAGDIIINTDNMSVTKDGKNVFVTPTEFQILRILIKNNGIIVTRAILLSNIWDDCGNFIDNNTLSVHISRLREKIGGSHIVTVRGIGYRWEDK